MISYEGGTSASILDSCVATTCEKHRHDIERKWHPHHTCQYLLHSGQKKERKTRNFVINILSKHFFRAECVSQTINYRYQKLRRKS